jgi:hypothetical protein
MLAFLGLSKMQLIITLVIIGVLFGGLSLLYIQNKSLRGDLTVATENGAKLEGALATQVQTTAAAVENSKEWQATLLAMQKRLEELANVERKAEAEKRRLATLFSEHDLTRLAAAKPGLIEHRINAGTAALYWMLERISRGDINNDGGLGAGSGLPTGAQPSTD